uniref:Uncharacterized protein n=1 Tax=Rousettus aegyptiacus TaxID=9407 RepID=A0A7J8F1V8_ROUAE|nr:hypothetical protein HJG63_012365 [Rousettus aegyptiacus]
MLAGTWKYYKESLCAPWKNISVKEQRMTVPWFSLQRLGTPGRVRRSGVPKLGGPKSSDQPGSAMCPQGSGCPQFRERLLSDYNSASRNAKVRRGSHFTTRERKTTPFPHRFVGENLATAQ